MCCFMGRNEAQHTNRVTTARKIKKQQEKLHNEIQPKAQEYLHQVKHADYLEQEQCAARALGVPSTEQPEIQLAKRVHAHEE